MITNVAASIRARLLNRARAEGIEFELLLVRFACERLLYRLGASEIRNDFILKGASLLALWMEEPYRATRDIDLLAYGENDAQTIRQSMKLICSVDCPDDGIEFDVGSLRISTIMEGRAYSGQRATIHAILGAAIINLQVDFGFDDVVTPGPEEAQLPTLLTGLPAPSLRTYPKESSIAEKLEAMVQLGRRNTRMKDFYDVWALSENFAFNGPELRRAIVECFNNRGTDWTRETPDVLTPAYFSDQAQQEQWSNYGHQGALLNPPPSSFDVLGDRLQAFIGPLRNSILTDERFDQFWPPGGPWQLRQ